MSPSERVVVDAEVRVGLLEHCCQLRGLVEVEPEGGEREAPEATSEGLQTPEEGTRGGGGGGPGGGGNSIG